MYRQFNAAAFQGPLTDSVGLESPAGYLRGCFQSAARPDHRPQHPAGRRPEPSAPGGHVQRARTRRSSRPATRTMTLASPADPVTITNLPYDATGAILPDSRAAERLGLRPGDRLADAAGGAVHGAVLVLGRGVVGVLEARGGSTDARSSGFEPAEPRESRALNLVYLRGAISESCGAFSSPALLRGGRADCSARARL